MDNFESMWESSRHNAWSQLTPNILNLASIALVVCAFVPVRWLRWIFNLTIVFICCGLAVDYSSQEIEEKWRIRNEYVKRNSDSLTESQRHAVTVDGANRLIGPIFIGGYNAFFRCAIVLLALAVIRRLITRMLPCPEPIREDDRPTNPLSANSN